MVSPMLVLTLKTTREAIIKNLPKKSRGENIRFKF